MNVAHESTFKETEINVRKGRTCKFINNHRKICANVNHLVQIIPHILGYCSAENKTLLKYLLQCNATQTCMKS